MYLRGGALLVMYCNDNKYYYEYCTFSDLKSFLYSDGPESGDVRLCYSSSTHSSYYGRVQIYLLGTWGGVTGSWTSTNAEAVCHQLGYVVVSKFFFCMRYIFNSMGVLSCKSLPSAV